MKQGWCTHYNGLAGRMGERSVDEGRTCDAGLEYRSVHVKRTDDSPMSVPCIAEWDHGLSTCPSRVFVTAEQEAESMRQASERLTTHFLVMAAGYCPHCGGAMTQRQIGRCQYAFPCQHRLNEIPSEIKGTEHIPAA